MITIIKQFLCWMRPGGHEYLYKTQDKRIFLECSECLRTTTGWTDTPRLVIEKRLK